ncbi:MAG TPA: alkaline phosphatase [Caulobacteraceae bacterium]|jgi:alkaline phosphatase
MLGLAAPGPAALAQTQAQRTDPYFVSGRQALDQALRLRPNTGRAKNVILFLGDGMGVSTVTAGRIFEGQSRGVDGESNVLAFEALPYAALSKTYSADRQVTDSAAGIDAIVTGVKTRNGVVGLGPSAPLKDCAATPAAVVMNIAELARASGRSTGAVTTTRLTHATPAGVYAHTPYRDWEADSDMEAGEGRGCPDIARQLVEAPPRARLNLALGGGRDRFLPKAAGGKRADGRDLTAEWARAPGSAYVTTAAQLEAARPGGADHLLGLFAPDHLPYEADRAKAGYGVPTLSQMTAKAIELLSRNRKGYFLLVEGGRIDHGSHAGNAYRTLSETAEFANAVRTALSKVDLRDTLVIVTADHSHGLTISGYPERNAPILGLARAPDEPLPSDRKAYTTLSFASGPGAAKDGARRDPAHEDTLAPDYRQSALVPMSSAAHGGEDVPVYAGGPQAHLIHGVVEESYIFQVMSHALGLDRRRRGSR